MYTRILKSMRDMVLNGQYVITLHADDEMCDDDLTLDDLKSVFVTGEIIERQRDRRTQEFKYLVEGLTASRIQKAVFVSKFSVSRKVVIVTAYLSEARNGKEHEV